MGRLAAIIAGSLCAFSLSTSLSRAACLSAPPDLISWWAAEGNANDNSPSGFNNGTIAGGVSFAQAKVGLGFKFDGVDGAIDMPDSPVLNFGPAADFSIEAWIMPQFSTTDFGVMSIVD